MMRVGLPSDWQGNFCEECGIASLLSTGRVAVNSSCLHPGLALEAFDYIMHKARIPFTVRRLMYADEYGVYKNGTWTGYLGHLQRNSVDLVVAPYWPLEVRLHDFDFTAPYGIERVMATIPRTIDVPSFVQRCTAGSTMFTQMFDWSLWAVIACTFAVLSVTL